MSDDHDWCRDVRRDEAVRAAEDAAAVPAIQHRDLPEQVALLWASVGDIIGRVVRLEGEMDAGQDDSASPAEGLRTERVTLEVTQRVEHYVSPSRWNWCRQLGSHAQPGESVRVVDEADAASDEAVAHGATLSALAEARESLAAANRGIARLTAERDAAIRERDAARAECERLRACADPFGEELAVIAAWERCAITADWPADEPETAVRCAASMEQEIVRLRARVAELEAAPAGNTGGEVNQEWIDDMRAGILALEYMLYIFRENCRPFVQSRMERLRRLVEVWRDHACPILSAYAGGEANQPQPQAMADLLNRLAQWDHMATAADGPYWVGEITKVLSGAASPPPPRSWLTAEEREAVDAAADAIGDRIDAYKEQDGDRRRIEVLDGLLARSTPPKVKRPKRGYPPVPGGVVHLRDKEWIAAIRAAGGEVEE